jgi:hypothetical protein
MAAWALTFVFVRPVQNAVAEQPSQQKLQISGIYPHLAVFSKSGEIGIGAVVPWAGKLWTLTYPPHEPRGGSDKLYAIDPQMNVAIRPESVGGTHACRMIHRESNQLIIGPYFIDAQGRVRAADVHKLVGRMTAVARHLTDPAHKVYFYDMEGAVYEVDVHSLAVTRLFSKPVPGWHGKGGYTAQGRLVIANNGESAAGKPPKKFLAPAGPKSSEDAGVLAQWDGRDWQVVARRQFTEVTGPGGIYGSPDDKSPLWSVGWDRRSVILELLDDGRWSRFRLPKASHTYDPRHGWYTEWPRIREVAGGQLLLTMHGMFYNFPVGFSAAETGGIRPVASYLRIIPDFCQWEDRLVLASDDASLMQNPLCGLSQSNFWFGRLTDLSTFGPRSGWGGPWLQDPVRAGQPSDAFLVHGFDRRVVHLVHDADTPVTFTLEIDRAGNGQWRPYQSLAVPAHGYRFYVFPYGWDANWIRLKTDKDCTATAYFHLSSPRNTRADDASQFASLAKVGDQAAVSAGLVRPAGHNHNLQFLCRTAETSGQVAENYYEADENLAIRRPAEDRSDEVRKIAAVSKDFEVDAASVIVSQGGRRYRLPRGDARYDRPFATGWPRQLRECVTERFLLNVHGTLYEMPRDAGLPLIKPVCSHGRQLMDLCTWRGLLVISGNLAKALPDGHYFRSEDERAGLWLGSIDDLWRLGKPVGRGGPWLRTAATPGSPSDPYLMTGYDRKRIELSHDAADDVEFTVEVDIDHHQWVTYQTFVVPAGQTVSHVFPEGFSAHWVRTRVNRACLATAQLVYE